VSELRNINWENFVRSLLDEDSINTLLKSKSLQWWLTQGFRKNGYMILDNPDELIIEFKECRYKVDLLNYPRIFEAYDRYFIENVPWGSSVLDVGANIGSYSIPVLKKRAPRKLVVVEPIFHYLLSRNIILNSDVHSDVNILKRGISSSMGSCDVDCQEVKAIVDSVAMDSIISQYGPFDVVRLDCGGAEKAFSPELFDGTKVFELELHFWDEDNTETWNRWKEFFSKRKIGYIARWSRSKHWLYVSANTEWSMRTEARLPDGSFRGESLNIWRGNV